MLFICLVFVMLSCLFIATLWSPAAPLFCGVLLCVTFPFGNLGQVWYLIVTIPDICHLSYYDLIFAIISITSSNT